jgi:pimeloyl-ACP methyl ester carboxylesterase
MAKRAGEIAPPSAFLLALELRGLFSVARLVAGAPFLAMAPRGTPQAVIVLPGLGATDRSTIAIRGYLEFLGYQATGWNRGRNVRPAGADLPAVAAQIRSLRDATEAPVNLVGWSRGGIIARERVLRPRRRAWSSPWAVRSLRQERRMWALFGGD